MDYEKLLDRIKEHIEVVIQNTQLIADQEIEYKCNAQRFINRIQGLRLAMGIINDEHIQMIKELQNI
jgi:hypothetical protein